MYSYSGIGSIERTPTLQIMQDTIITLTLVVAAIRIQVPIVTVVCGLEAVASAQMS